MPQFNVWHKPKKDATFFRKGDYVSADDVANAIALSELNPGEGDMCFVVDTSTGVGTLVRAKFAEITFDIVGSGGR